jgi:hypothetical protein
VGVLTSSSLNHGPSYCPWYQPSSIFVRLSYFVFFRLLLTDQAKIVYFLYRHSHDANKFIQSKGSVNRRHYFRILALTCIDILLTLPLGVINVTVQLLSEIREPATGFPFRFYYGWSLVHSNWGPVAIPYSEEVDGGFWTLFELYSVFWTSPILAIAIFALFGLTSEARAAYWSGFCTVAKLFGWTPPASKDEDLGDIEFCTQQLTMTERCALCQWPR